MRLLIVVADKFGFYAPVQRLALAVPKLSHVPHAESLAGLLLQVLAPSTHYVVQCYSLSHIPGHGGSPPQSAPGTPRGVVGPC